MSPRPPRKTIYHSEDVKELRPYRLQYNMVEAGYMLSVTPETVKKWADKHQVSTYKIKDSDGKWYITHNHLVELVEKSAHEWTYGPDRFLEYVYERIQTGKATD